MNIKHIGFAALAVAGLSACADQLDYKEYRVDDQAYMSDHWGKVETFVMRAYLNLEYDFGQMYSGAMLASTTDEAVYSSRGHQIEQFYNGAWSAVNHKQSIWNSSYESISYCNLYLDNFVGLKFEDYLLDLGYAPQYHRYQNFQYELRWLRAFYYYSLVRQYGGVPLKINHMEADEANSLPRATADEVFDFIDAECAAIQDSIIKDYNSLGIYAISKVENGRANDLAVRALRARAALYHASPLFNPNNDRALWEHAAEVTKALIDSCEGRGMGLCPDYAKLFDKNNYADVANALKEIIFLRRVNPNDLKLKVEQWNFPTGMTGASGGNCPSQTLVDAYEMTNGKLISDPASGYDPQNPYVDRDKRFYATVVTNGEHWPNAISDDETKGVETYIGGKNGLPLLNATPTGYYLKKFVDNALVISGNQVSPPSNHSFITFRLGEFYLNYAEIMMNLGDNATALEYINKVRVRAGQPELTAAELTAERYENERFVELAFEGHRFFDVRRWKKGAQYFESNASKPNVRTMRIEMQADSSFSYNASGFETRVWDEKFNLFPIPQSELLKNGGNWKQNDGWK